MQISVLGTGMVGRTLAGRLAELGHDVVVGTRDPATTGARGDVAQWQREHPAVRLVPAPEAGSHAEVLVNATAGTASLDALTAAGVEERAGLVVLDVANALDFSGGVPSLAVAGADSLGEQIQRRFPDARVIKALNTMNCAVMVDPARVPGAHVVLVAGDDAAAKRIVVGLLGEFGWTERTIIDLGGIVAARSTEMYLPLWLSLMGVLGTSDFNIAVVRA